MPTKPFSTYQTKPRNADEASGTIICPQCGKLADVVDYTHSGRDELYSIHYWCYGGCNSTGVVKLKELPDGISRGYKAILTEDRIRKQ